MKLIAYSLVLAVSTTALLTVLHGGYRLQIKKFTYPLEAEIALLKESCSTNAPSWLRAVNRIATRHHGSPRNQIALIDRNGRLHNCESGWGNDYAVISRNARFRYASLTKVFTAIQILDLADIGDLDLDTPLIDIIPVARPLKDHRIELITVRHLLYHQAGFDRLQSRDPMFNIGRKSWCPKNIENLSRLTLDFTPGERSSYSNLGYCLLGAILEKKTKTDFRYLTENRFHLQSSGIKFIDGPYLPDEIKYDFRNSLLLGEDYWERLDFLSLASSAGLSGSAIALAQQLSKIENAYNRLQGVSLGFSCNLINDAPCTAGTKPIYKEPNETLAVLTLQGNLIGNAALAVIDNHGNTVVWLGGGASPNPQDSAEKITQYIYKKLSQSEL